MLRSVKSLKNYSLAAKDGHIGHLLTLYFDDQNWSVKYLVVDTGNWLPGKKILLTSNVVGEPDWADKSIFVSLTKNQILTSPTLDTNIPVSEQHKKHENIFQGAMHFFIHNETQKQKSFAEELRIETDVPEMGAEILDIKHDEVHGKSFDPHLRSCQRIKGYHIQTLDKELGHIEDFIIDDETWEIKQIVVATKNWVPGRMVMCPPDLVTQIDCEVSKICLNITAADLYHLPEFDVHLPANKVMETRFYDYAGKPMYWSRKFYGEREETLNVEGIREKEKVHVRPMPSNE